MSESESSVIDQVTAHLKKAFGDTEPQRASVTFLGLESIDVLRFTGGTDEVEYVSLGCSRHPMGEPDQIVVDPDVGPRGEIVIRMYASAPLPGLHRSVAMLAAAPAVEGLVLTADALIDLGEPLWKGSRCSAVVLETDPIPPCPLSGDREDVNFFRAIPVTANEAAWIRLKGVDALRAAWAEAGIDVRDPARAGATIG
ncbi:suppressor of fused protein SUFU [Williamsia limnetica]|uniref:Suppressor of fused protein SUFU n=1 Tax=Williamsia limnetica TaxID=882452 RepID=A0A318RCU6_WILLI|nr:suppressor of fused domain protein [Williamsia limnetica]PYE12603.1 suppressor of fused protein SUFU [Williamsia limnetica]